LTSVKAGAGPFPDRVALKLRERTKHVKNQPATWRGSIDLLSQTMQPDVAGIHPFHRVDRVRRRPPQPVQLPDRQCIAVAQISQCFGQSPRLKSTWNTDKQIRPGNQDNSVPHAG